MTDNGLLREMDWSISPEKIQSKAEKIIETTKVTLDEIAKTPEGEESLATLLIFEEALASCSEVIGPLTFLKYVSTDKTQRDAADEVEKEGEKFENEIWSRNDIFNVLVRLEPHMNSLDPQEKTLLKKTLDEFRHRGAALAKDERMEFLEIANNITVLESEFGRTLNEITTTVPCTVEDLEGVPPQVYEDLEKDDDKYLITLDYPVYNPVVQYAKNPETRKRMTIAYYQRGGTKNSERLEDAIALRERQAKLLGHSNFAEYMISRKMAKKPERVIEFMEDLKEKLTPLSKDELAALKELRTRDEGADSDDPLPLHDLFYYHEMMMREKYAVDQNKIKEYFPMERIVEGVLDVYQKILNLDFQEIEDKNVWHTDVREFRVFDKITGNLMGTFYLDLFPREGKYKHYAVFDFLSRREKDGKILLPITSMVANFQIPSKKQPSLLTHNEVVTFFHEFGHLMHVVTNRTKYARFSLDGVLPDFIEVPSIMLENWAWQKEVLSNLSGHYENPEEKLPDNLVKGMIDAKLLDVGILQLRQVFYSLIDMFYHTRGAKNTTEDFVKIFKEITGFDFPDDTRPDAGFGHLMSSYYAAGYYSYLWSRVYAQDLFTKFEENGFMDEKTGLEYREKILAPGGSIDANVLVEDFLGRKANSRAFLRSLGIGK